MVWLCRIKHRWYHWSVEDRSWRWCSRCGDLRTKGF